MKILFLFVSVTLLVFSISNAQSLSFQQIGSVGGEVGSSNNNTLSHSLGAVASTVIENGPIRLDQGMFLACDILCDSAKTISSSSRASTPLFSIYPNPVENLLFLAGETEHLHHYILFAADGRVVGQATLIEKQISLASYPNGLYLLQVYDRSGKLTLTRKLLKH